MNELRKKEALAGIIGAAAGVISAVIGGFALYSQHSAGSFNDFAKMVMLGQLIKQNDPVLQIPHAPPPEQRKVYNNFTVDSNGCLTEDAFREAVSIAAEMNSSSTRNENLDELISHALCRNDAKDAEWASDKITSSYSRDAAYTKIIGFLTEEREFGEANKVTVKIESSYSKDKAKELILESMKIYKE
jgi:hypothetical protein